MKHSQKAMKYRMRDDSAFTIVRVFNYPKTVRRNYSVFEITLDIDDLGGLLGGVSTLM